MNEAINPKWHFIEIRDRGIRNVDPSEGIHFEKLPPIGAVIRESAQNSLDASYSNEHPVHMRISVHTGNRAMPRSMANNYLNGLLEHLNAAGEDNLPSPKEDMSYVVVEDFYTLGLQGDPNIFFDNGDMENNRFYWFHRNTNRTQARNTRGGSFGYGKASFALASKIRSFITVSRDKKSIKVFGNSISKGHQIGGTQYQPYGDFGFEDNEDGSIGILPSQNEAYFKQICEDFGLSRGDQVGLSVIIPFPEREYQSEELIQSIIRNYFLPICQNKLTVEVVGEHSVTINSDTILEVTDRMDWTGEIAGAMTSTNRKCQLGMVELASWWAQGREKDTFELEPFGERQPYWDRSLIKDEDYESMRSVLESGKPLAIRASLPIFKKNARGRRDRYSEMSDFYILIKKHQSYGGSDAVWIRRYLSVPDRPYKPKESGFIAIMISPDGQLEQLLRDSEDVAHTQHRITRVEKKYKYAGDIVRFFRRSSQIIIGYLQEEKNVLETDWLDDWFPSEQIELGEDKESRKKLRRKKKKNGSIEEELIIGPPKPPEDLNRNHSWDIQKAAGGFSIYGELSHDLDYLFRVKVGYSRDDNTDALKKWKRFDFDFSEGIIDFVFDGVNIEKAEGNLIIFSVKGPINEYSIDVTGFDLNRDLFVHARPIMIRKEEVK